VSRDALLYVDDVSVPLALQPEETSAPLPRERASGRHNRTLDGLRGCFALVVVAEHVRAAYFLNNNWGLVINTAAQLAVLGFFVLSGLVLTRAWKGHYGHFLLRRFVRLWPLYALMLAAGYALAHRAPAWSEFLWWPILSATHPIHINDPAWSLCVEAWAMLAMPIFVWAGRGSLIRALAAAVVFSLAGRAIDANFVFGVFFIAGAFLSRYEFHWAKLETPIFQWFGRISYPLYLSHWLVLRYMPAAIPVRVLACFVVAWALTMTVERWSIQGSRAV